MYDPWGMDINLVLCPTLEHEAEMDIEDLAYTVESHGKQWVVMEDSALVKWSEERGIDPLKAQVQALEKGIIPLRYLRNFGALDFHEQIRICRSRVLICGCGGLGGTLINLLARAGVGMMRLVDGDAFAPSNLNRQILCDTHQLSREKARVAAETVQAINPFVTVQFHPVDLNEENMAEVARGMDLILDALDNLTGRFLVERAARNANTPFIHAAVAGWWGQISTFLPQSRSNLKMIYGSRQVRDSVEESFGVLGPTAATIGSLEALEAIRILCGREPAYADQLFYFDGVCGHMNLVPL